MKFRCERDTLVEALATASRAVTSRASTHAALNGVRIEVGGEPADRGRGPTWT